ncbi:C-type lectin domain family 2 member B-like isoform X2 [Sceloporus undulatus]|uniref:C-type lectin domain family 2 member B-like isoform X2 n=1 Tax=Sceloporus undulatus TaxID=8520 RepID=UPI001C4DB2EB|nr:C-type lectin domain family 2 member B-like isoform X2 [Sceloporus undulatus]XP_042304685.1 C-type lectin domain family 2 member B-like isoform X2 [Sceloporus undulatus]
MSETHKSKEEWQHDCLLDLHAKENGLMNGSIKVEESPLKTEYCEDGYVSKRTSCLRSRTRNYAIYILIWCIAVGSVILNLIFFTALSVRQCDISPTPLPLLPGDPCPDGWIGFQRKCYYFSAAERNWTSSSLHCSSHNASLAVIDSQEEMGFLLRHKSPPDHWIGLRRDNPLQPWRWINGTISHEWFTIYGGGRCAYMNHEVIASSSCTREEHWICSKPCHLPEATF